MVTPLEQFRAHYPSAALIADLVSAHDGQYVVRAAIVQKGETLATGLAASGDVQIAEDRARERAIALLGINTGDVPTGDVTPTPEVTPATNGNLPSTAGTPAAKLVAAPTTQPAANPAEAAPTSTAQMSTTQASTTQTPEPVQTEMSSIEPDTELQIEPKEVPPLPPEEDFGPPIDAIAEGPADPTPAKPSAAAIAMENLSASTSPVDLSDVIAQTDVELTRLGWTSDRGREYLKVTYNKLSRQQLTDEELMSFLLHLEDQN